LDGAGITWPSKRQSRLAAWAPRARAAASRAAGAWRFVPLLAVLVLVAVITAPAHATGDEGPLIAAAHRLLHGYYADTGSMDGTKYLWHGPGLPAMLAPLVALGLPLSWLRLTSPLLMFLAALCFYRLLRIRLTRRGALIGAYAVGLYLPGYYVLGQVAKEPLALLLSVLALDATTRYLRQGRRRHGALAGLALGALAMTRVEYGWIITAALVGAAALWMIARIRGGAGARAALVGRRCAVICAVGLLACLPWLGYTFSLTHHVFYWGNSGGLSLYWMSSPSPAHTGEWYAPHTVMSDPALAAYRPFFRHLATLRPVARDLELQHVAIVQALGHPAKYALNLLANAGRMFLGFPYGFTLPAAVIAGLVAINGSLAAGVVAAGRRLWRLRGSLPPETAPFVVFGALALALHLFPSAEPRMVVPIMPVPIWLIGYAFARRRRSRAGATAAA
jgi:hypothetical protein